MGDGGEEAGDGFFHKTSSHTLSLSARVFEKANVSTTWKQPPGGRLRRSHETPKGNISRSTLGGKVVSFTLMFTLQRRIYTDGINCQSL